MADFLHVYITGRVQGVCFRYYTQSEAISLGLKGWVRNLYDGRVEAEFEGAKDLLEQMLDWCRKGPTMSKVSQVQTEWNSGPAKYDSFRIRM